MSKILKITFLGIALLCILPAVKAQHFPILSHYLLNDYAWNPAVAGSKKQNPFNINVRRQWVGVQDAPQVHAISFHGLLFQYRIGMGGMIYNNVTGPSSVTGGQYTWSYQLPIRAGRSRLGFGLTGEVAQRVLDTRNLELETPDDPAISGAVERAFIPEAHAGIYYYSDYEFNVKKRYWLGASAMNLLQTDKRVGNQVYNTLNMDAAPKNYFLMGGYGFTVWKKLRAEPSFLIKVKQDDKFDFSEDVADQWSGRLVWNDSLWIGGSYRKGDAAVAMIGVMTGGLSICYSYDFIISDLEKYTTGSHEIAITLNFRRREKKVL